MHANNLLKRVNSLSSQVTVYVETNVVDTFRGASRVRFVASLCSPEVVDIVFHVEVAGARLGAAVFLVALFVIVLTVHFLSFVTVEEQIGGLVRPQFCGVVNMAFIPWIVVLLFVHLFLVVSLSSVALSSIDGGLFVALEVDVGSAQQDIVGLSGTTHPFSRACLVVGSGYTTRPFLWCFGVLVSIFVYVVLPPVHP